MPAFEFVKSSHSSGDGECVVIARNLPGTVAVRDSKAVGPHGPLLRVAPAPGHGVQPADALEVLPGLMP